MKKIQLLSENLINQIAAGEVIEKPASIVKELVENSIDAGANRIEVELSNAVRNIRVSDNGSGIDKDDAALAFSRHATSKLKQESDLWSIGTLGFRGEALASIISVSKVICTTRTAEYESGIRLECENSNISIAETGCAIGTIMEVKDLFYNVPVRSKFLKKEQTELANVVEILQGIAISYPNVAISLINKGNTILKTTGSSDISTVISEIYSKDLIRDLIDVYKDDLDSGLVVSGVVSKPDFTRANKKAIYTFVNGRTVKCPVLLKSIDSAYKDLIPSGRYPFVVLNISISARQVDVNVHPAKREVRYTNPNQIFNFILSAVKGAFESQSLGFSYNLPKYEIVEFVPEDLEPEQNNYIQQTNTFKKDLYREEPSNIVNFMEMKQRVEKSVDFYAPPVQSKIELFSENEQKYESKFRIVGQLFNTYIVLESAEGVQIVDQHIANERAIYERLKESKNPASQLLLALNRIFLEPAQIAVIEEKKGLLAGFGYDFEVVEDNSIILKKVPQVLAKCDPVKIVQDLAESLESDLEHLENRILISMSCQAAVKAGEKLSIWQIEELIKEWQLSKNNWTCPHGRKIAHNISSKELAGFFGRVDKV